MKLLKRVGNGTTTYADKDRFIGLGLILLGLGILLGLVAGVLWG